MAVDVTRMSDVNAYLVAKYDLRSRRTKFALLTWQWFMVSIWSARVLALVTCSAVCLAPTTIQAQGSTAPADAAFGDASYVVQIHSTTENFVPPPLDTARTHVMTTESGQRFTCFLPPAPAPISADEEDKTTSKPGKQKDESALVSFGRAASKKIRPKCLQYVDTEQHWVYELCPGVLVRRVSLLELAGDLSESRTVDVNGELVETTQEPNGDAEDEPASETIHDVMELGAFATERSQPAVKFTEVEDAETGERVQHHKKPLFTQVFPTGSDEILVQFMCSAKAYDDAVAAVQWKPQEQGKIKIPSAFLVVSRLYCDARFSDSEDHKLFTVASLLSPLRDLHTCIKRNEGWWTYEFCFGKGVRQYHRDSDGRVTVDFSLGHYDEDKNRALEASGGALVSEQIDATHDVSRPAYLEHYSHGTYCKEFDMQTPRTSRVFFYCSQGGANHHILAVKETQTCAYTIKISTPVLCDHPHFISDEQKSAAKTEIVHCVPLNEEVDAGELTTEEQEAAD